MEDSENRGAQSAAWGVAAVVFGGFAGALYSVHGKGFPIWPLILTLVAVAGLYMCFATLWNWWPAIRNRSTEPPELDAPDDFEQLDYLRSHTGRPLGKGLGALIPDISDVPDVPDLGPLQIRLLDEDWELWQGCAWIAAMKFQLTNHTKATIRLARFHLDSDRGEGPRPKLTQAQVDGIFHERRRRADALTSLRRMELHPTDSTTGWWVQHAYLPYPERAGRPRCVFIVTDEPGNTYELEIPARPPKSHRVPSASDDA